MQNLIGVLPKFNQMRQSMSEADANAMSMRVELQADCFAGVWGHYTAQKGLLEQGDVEEALNAAQQIGDDTLQKRMQGYVVPESFNHGTSRAAPEMVRGRAAVGQAVLLRHVQQPDLIRQSRTKTSAAGALVTAARYRPGQPSESRPDIALRWTGAAAG